MGARGPGGARRAAGRGGRDLARGSVALRARQLLRPPWSVALIPRSVARGRRAAGKDSHLDKEAPMEFETSKPTRKAPADTFTGDAWIDEIVRGEPPSRVRAG